MCILANVCYGGIAVLCRRVSSEEEEEESAVQKPAEKAQRLLGMGEPEHRRPSGKRNALPATQTRNFVEHTTVSQVLRH